MLFGLFLFFLIKEGVNMKTKLSFVIFLSMVMTGFAMVGPLEQVHANDYDEFLYDESMNVDEEGKPLNVEDDGSVSDELSTRAGQDMGVDEKGVSYFKSAGERFVTIITALIFAFSAIMIVFAGFKLTTSEGDASRAKKAKMQIIVAGIGIGLAVMNLVVVQLFREIINVLN